MHFVKLVFLFNVSFTLPLKFISVIKHNKEYLLFIYYN